MDIGSIIIIAPDQQRKFIPPLSDYTVLSGTWEEAEFPCLDQAAERVRAAYWTGEPGRIRIERWPYTEVCSMLRGRIVIDDLRGGRREFIAGDGFIVPKGFAGEWITLESSAKIFVAID